MSFVFFDIYYQLLMSRHGKLRENKRCENCGYFVETRFCPECGQENVETRQPFHYLFTVSIEDFVHYDSRFWKTILYLLFYPARLTKIYLSGKRKLYVPPVTLYIFISFITFFVTSLLPENGEMKQDIPQETTTEAISSDNQDDVRELEKNNKSGINGKEIDKEKLKERIMHDFPKAIFLYMPVFAFWLWLFHDKKKWYYFDHGIFTIHYFSFILLSVLMFILIHRTYSFFDMGRFHRIKTITVFASIAMFFYFIYYFFHSHRIVYREYKAISRLKCSFLFLFNSICIFIFLLLYLIVEVYITDKIFFTEIVNSITKIRYS